MGRIPKKLPRDVNARAGAIARILVDEDDENIDPRRLDAINEARAKAARAESHQ